MNILADIVSSRIMTGNSANRIEDIANRSNEMRIANEEGYQKLQDAREAVRDLSEITARFNC